MTAQADLVDWFAKQRNIVRTMWVVTTEASNTARIHQALDKIIALHAIFVSRSIGKMLERRFAKIR